MKKTYLALLPFSALVLSASIALFSKENYQEVKGYTAQNGNLPSTIDLNDKSEADVRAYYSNLLTLDSSERKGTNLLKNLKPILSEDQKYYAYDGSSLWQMYEITDRDWAKSPASSTKYGTYNSTTNKITNYVYGTSKSNSKNNPYIHALYVNRNVENQTTAWDDHNQSQWGINQEHIWPKSQGFEEAGEGGARGDPMHLWAGNGRVNGTEHSNYMYGYVDTSKSYIDPVTKVGYTNLSGNYSGFSKTFPNSTATVFEPQDSDKGDIARAVFYMVARYNYISGSDPDGISTNNPNLELVESPQKLASYTCSTTVTGKLGILSDLLEWNRLDPPDEWEIHRNNLLHVNYTNNRNPFIDFPEWAEYIWGQNTSGSYANPSTDTLNDFSSAEYYSVEGVSLRESATIAINGRVVLSPSFTPSKATNKNVTWTSSNPSVASVNSGIVTGISAGTSTITVTTEDGGFTATCSITVTNEVIPEGQTSLTINYADTFSPVLPTASGSVNENLTVHEDTTANISFKELHLYKGSSAKYIMFYRGNSVSGYLCNTKSLGTIDSVEVTYSSTCSASAKTGVYFGSTEQSTYQSNSNKTIKAAGGTDKWTNTVEGNGFFQVSTSGSSNCQITDIKVTYHPVLKSLELTNQTTSFYLNDEFEFGGSVIAKYDGGPDVDVTGDVTITGYDLSVEGEQTVTVIYTQNSITKTATYTINVSEYNAIESVSLSSSTLKFDLNSGSLTHQLSATVEKVGSKTTDAVVWNTSNSSIATVSNGLVTAKSTGTAVITATSTYDNTKSATCSITVIDSSVVVTEVTDVITKASTGITGTGYSAWSGVTASSDAIYAGNTAGSYDSVQMRTTGSNSGIVSTSSGGTIKSVSVSWNSNTASNRSIIVYGSSSAYSSAADLFNSSTYGTELGTISLGSTSLTITGEYQYIGIRSSSGALYLDSISITWNTSGSVTPVEDDSHYLNGYKYKMYLTSTYSGNEGDYFFTGTRTGNYFDSVKNDYSKGTDVYFEKNGDGQNIYYYDSTNVKQYLTVTNSGTSYYLNKTTSVPSIVWKYDSTNHYTYTYYGEQLCIIGTYNQYTTFGISKYLSNTTYTAQFKDTAETFSSYFLNKITCDNNGVNAPTFASNYSWTDFITLYNSLDSSEQEILRTTQKSETGSVIAQAMAKYEFIVWKYGSDGVHTDFINRGVTPRSTQSINVITSGTIDNSSLIIILAALVSTLSIVSLVMIKKKKIDK